MRSMAGGEAEFGPLRLLFGQHPYRAGEVLIGPIRVISSTN